MKQVWRPPRRDLQPIFLIYILVIEGIVCTCASGLNCDGDHDNTNATRSGQPQLLSKKILCISADKCTSTRSYRNTSESF